jgi:predicted RNase H-like nuclease (RuvC/YqgF family)
MNEITGDDHPTYEDSVYKFYENKLTEINKQLDLLKENSDLEQNNFKLKKKFSKLKKKFAHSQNEQSLKDGIHKDNLERLMQENFELRHRLSCIVDDIEFIERHISSYKKSRKWFKQPSLDKDGSAYADQAWHHVTNIQIACDLSDGSPLEWSSEVMTDAELDNLNRDL